MRDAFYIAAVTIVQCPAGCTYYVHTNAGTSMYYHFNDLPVIVQKYINENIADIDHSFPFVMVVSNGGVTVGD